MKTKITLTLFCLFSLVYYSQAQDKNWIFHLDQNIRPAYTIGGEMFYGMEAVNDKLDILHGPTAGMEVSPFKNVFIVPKASYKLAFCYQALSVKTGFMIPTDFKTTDLRWYSGIGISLIDVINVSYEYSLPFNEDNMLSRVSRHNINFQLMIPFPKIRVM